MGLNGRGFEVIEVECAVCFEVYDVAPNDPHDNGGCPKCIENNVAAEALLEELYG